MALCDSFLPGATFALLNAKGGTALDDCHETEVRGYPFHGRENQQWKFINTGNGWAIQSCRTKEGGPVYLSLKKTLSQYAHLAMSPRPVSWYVWHVKGGLRIGWPSTDYVVELGNQGSSEAGTQVIIAHLRPDDLAQVWHFSRVDIGSKWPPPPKAAPQVKSEVTDSEGDTVTPGAAPPTLMRISVEVSFHDQKVGGLTKRFTLFTRGEAEDQSL